MLDVLGVDGWVGILFWSRYRVVNVFLRTAIDFRHKKLEGKLI